MPKVQLNDLSSLANETSAIALINANNAAIEEGFNNTVSRDGTSPNTLEDDINMNSHRIYNVPLVPQTNADVATKYYVDVLAGNLDPDNNDWEDLNVINDLTVGGDADVTGTVTAGSIVTTSIDTTTLSVDTLTVTDDITLTGASPTITFTDTDTNADSRITADSGAGSINIQADINNESANSNVGIHIDGSVVANFNSTNLNPGTNDGLALGTGSLSYSDLFLASGGVINFANSNATLTHSTGLLTSSVPLSLGTSNALTAGTIELGAASDTTLSRASAGNVNIEGNIIYRAGGTDVPVTDGGTGISSATAYGTIIGGTTSTGAFQVVSPGTSGHVLTSNGSSAAPTFQASVSGGPVVEAQIATNTSATAYTLATGIPSSASIIFISFVDVSTNSNVNGLIQIGDSGGFETTGYNSFIEATGLNEASATDGYIFWMNTSGSNYTGIMQLMRQGSTNTWVQVTNGNVTGAEAQIGGGWKTLSAALDRIQILAVGGTATFDAGTVSVTYM